MWQTTLSCLAAYLAAAALPEQQGCSEPSCAAQSQSLLQSVKKSNQGIQDALDTLLAQPEGPGVTSAATCTDKEIPAEYRATVPDCAAVQQKGYCSHPAAAHLCPETCDLPCSTDGPDDDEEESQYGDDEEESQYGDGEGPKYPENASLTISGFECANGRNADINQAYIFWGKTADGKPYYRGSTSTWRWLYFDHRCADDSKEPRWLMGQKPDPTRSEDLNVNDGEGCNNDFAILSTKDSVPTGSVLLDWQWCGDHGYWRGGAHVDIRMGPPMGKPVPGQCLCEGKKFLEGKTIPHWGDRTCHENELRWACKKSANHGGRSWLKRHCCK